jgi:hypothetical protein
MLAEDHIVLHMDDIHGIISIVLLEELQDFQLNASLVVVLLLVLDNF